MDAFCSIFSQLLKVFPRGEFEQIVAAHDGERHARGFTCWEQFVSMMFCQLGRAQSLREICQGLASAEGKLNHLGIEAPARSTLAYANEHRPWQLYESVFHATLAKCRQAAPHHALRFKNRLASLDSTTIDLCASIFDWARFRRTKGAVKLHMLLDHDGLLPEFAVITEGKTADIRVARKIRFPAGTVVVFDRGYNDYRWFDSLTADGVYFVTRMKAGSRYQVVERRALPKARGVLSDEIILLETGSPAVEPFYFRRVEIENPDGGDSLVFLTNHLEFGATTIAQIYKQRWQVELFFKALKQNLRVKTFVGTSANALKVQIWTALIAILVLKYLQLKARYDWSLSNLIAMLRFNLFAHRDLWSWLHDPFPKQNDQSNAPLQLQLA
jgi:hypothetical protein